MRTTGSCNSVCRRGSALAVTIALLLFVVAVIAGVSALAASRAATATLQQKEDRARTSARSGADIILYVLQEMKASERVADGTTVPQLKAELERGFSMLDMNGVSIESSGGAVSISSVILNDSTGQSFSAIVTSEDGKNVTANVTGRAFDITRRLRLKCNVVTGTHLIYDPAEIPSHS